MTDTEMMDWIEVHQGKYTEGGYLDWFDGEIGRFTKGKDLRDCVLKAQEKEND